MRSALSTSKSLDVVGLSWLTRLCNIAWRLGTVPLEWQTGVVVPLFKKGDRRVCSNYRGITLLSLPGKVYARVLERRIRPIVDPRIQEEQCGFRPGRGTVDQLYTLRRVLEGLWEFAQPVHMCFVDLEKAFDRVPRGILWGVLHAVWGPGAFAKGCSVSVRPEQELGSHCRQISSRQSQGPEGVRFGNHRISSLLFADDVVLLASSSQDLQHVLERFAAECEAAGMRISTSKSEAMVTRPEKGGVPSPGGVESVRSYAVGVYRTVVVKKELSRKAKLSIYRSIYVPTLTYGHELWVMTERTRSADTSGRNEFPPAGWLGAPLEIGEVFQACPTREEASGKTQDTLRDYVSRLAWERLSGIPPEELEEVSGVREVWASLLRLLPPRPGQAEKDEKSKATSISTFLLHVGFKSESPEFLSDIRVHKYSSPCVFCEHSRRQAGLSLSLGLTNEPSTPPVSSCGGMFALESE
ncbi:hypothetical protein L3Q82_018573 [Scortum barcoo]|uniref:Uncharacterized protein n=1 Tax=Scortum barcoo TaxID=214431 RepID=A0ACB8VF51_9TELE|nr:hypothetical protein L3Q82_018573 [Scortum barcoo]